jgi:hypothetical protein
MSSEQATAGGFESAAGSRARRVGKSLITTGTIYE